MFMASDRQRPPRTGYVDSAGVYHPGPSYVGFDAHADICGHCDLLRAVAEDYVDRRPAPSPPWARDVPLPIGTYLEHGDGSMVPARPFVRLSPVWMPIPGPWPEPERLGWWSRVRCWLRYRPAAWPMARLVQR